MPRRRPPHPDLRQWESRACEAAMAAQLLYMAGLLEIPFDTAAFDARLARTPGDYDLTNGTSRVLLEAGFGIHSICASDATVIIKGIDYARQTLIEHEDTPPEAAATLTPDMYAKMRQRAQSTLDLRAQYPGRCQQDVRRVTLQDLQEALEAGHAVEVVMSGSTAASAHANLLTHAYGDGYIDVYDPDHGLYTDYLDEGLMADLLPGATIFRFPQH